MRSTPSFTPIQADRARPAQRAFLPIIDAVARLVLADGSGHYDAVWETPENEDTIFTLDLSARDLMTLHGGLREALEALDDWDFPIRMGVTAEEARSLMTRLRAIVEGPRSDDPV